uniref:Uncharacterized protein n=1 Tax=Heterorhabditis bacteriophora TaxID=37862 RepID=A0A1I7XQL1_HETBA
MEKYLRRLKRTIRAEGPALQTVTEATPTVEYSSCGPQKLTIETSRAHIKTTLETAFYFTARNS